jgi:YYY domain-containing protein
MHREKYFWVYDVLLLLVLVLAGYLRLNGINWGEGEYQHPDENFLSGVLGSLQAQTCGDANLPVTACPPEQKRWLGIRDYFNSKTSTLNPYNLGYGSFVYGNLPMTLIRIAADLTAPADVRILGRQASAFADLFAIFMLYLVVSRVYDRRVGLLAALFSALTVTQIQQSHFFTTDLFVNAFAFLAIYFAVEIVMRKEQRPKTGDVSADSIHSLQSPASTSLTLKSLLSNPLFLLSLGFGITYGMALASKLNIYPLAILLPGAFALRYWTIDRGLQTEQPLDEETGNGPSSIVHRPLITNYHLLILACLIAGGLAAFLSFRVFQPYAFDGLGLDPRWVADIKQQRVQASGDADLPWNLQWARRSNLYSFTNLTVWGLGLPLGILAWIGFLYMGWRILKGEWRHALLWGWTAAYFVWQSLQFNPTMRYQLPIYPLLAMMAAWVVFEPIQNYAIRSTQYATRTAYNVLRIVITLTVIVLTALWAFAFQSIYTRTEPRIAASKWIYQNVPGPINLQIQTPEGETYNQPLPVQPETSVTSASPYDLSFIARRDGLLTRVTLGHAANALASSSTLDLTLSSGTSYTPEETLAAASLTADFSTQNDPRGDTYTIELDKPINVTKDTQYYLRLQINEGILAITGSAVVNETDYDYPLPFRLDGYDAFGGLYRGDLNLQVYWDDNADKLTRFTATLDQADYIFIPTNHQYAQITRLPERYPLTTLYYRELIGCPIGADIIRCYYEAQPGTYEGRLGFDLVAVFETFPKLGSFEINDQYAEEAFTFYDHPKVLIFKKNANYDSAQVKSILSAVDLTKVVRLTPRQFDDYSNLLLPADRLAAQRAGGTWSELFDYDWIQNKYPWLGLLVWYVFIFILGLAIYPLIRIAMPGLADKGYPLSRALGLVLFGWLAWMAGSLGIPYTRTTIAVAFGGIILLGAVLGHLQRGELIEEWKTKRKYFLMIEGFFLAFFVVDLLIRIGNPDLWHPAKGGERPMDFSYFNAVIKSTSFPPYDPWFAGGYINYYYYGFVLVGTPVKLLGIVPSIAYNFILPTLFAIVGICAFSLGWNLLTPVLRNTQSEVPDSQPSSLIAGLAASLLTILLGNLGTVQTIYNRMQQLGSAGAFSWDSTFTQRIGWATQGLKTIIRGESTLPIGPGDWYWDPSRVIPPRGGNEITEFPLFTFIYSDLHASMIVMPLALLAISWALSVLAARARWPNQARPAFDRRASTAVGFVVGGLILGAVYPTNLSDSYTYLLVGMAALAYSIWRYAEAQTLAKRIALTLGAVFALYALSTYLYAPYRAWYSQAYSALDPWKGPFTPIASYLTMWGVFLFIIVAWMVWETREWMASTPVSSLRKLKPFQILIEGALIVFALILLLLQYNQSNGQYGGAAVSWIALPIAAWAGILLLRPTLPDAKRFVLFLIGAALLITVVVEVVVVRGDIGRQNTIFKFYLQSWFMLAISSGAAFAWTLPPFFRWNFGWRAFWQTAMILLVTGAAMYTVTGASGKIRDRWILEAPRTLDSMTFMQYANYDDFGQRLDLSEDYRAIRWMQDNVQGSPVIVETNCPEYRWCTRFTIYTGLPGVVGWNWHQRQQRVFTSTQVEARVAEVGNFYNSVDPETIRTFLKTYDVKYIIVGQLERAAYTPEGIAKFDQLEGQYWREVYRDGATVIYEVMP